MDQIDPVGFNPPYTRLFMTVMWSTRDIDKMHNVIYMILRKCFIRLAIYILYAVAANPGYLDICI